MGARLIGIQDSVGTMTKGMEADLVVIEGNPLRRVEMLQNREKIVGVMKAGKFVTEPLTNR